MQNPPKVTMVKEEADIGHCRFLLEGGDIAPDWTESLRLRADRERTAGREVDRNAHCEVSIWFHPHGEGGIGHVGSYGGSVWPLAWPELFVRIAQDLMSAGIAVTEEGWALIQAAREA